MPDDSARPTRAQAPVTVHDHCQPPLATATSATAGGPANWPTAESCCIQPTVVERVAGSGARRTESANSVPGIRPPRPENATTAASRATGPTPSIGQNASTEPRPIAAKPARSRRGGATPRCSSRPAAMLPAPLAIAASAVSAPTVVAAPPASASIEGRKPITAIHCPE